MESKVVAIFDDHEEALEHMTCSEAMFFSLYTAIVPDFRGIRHRRNSNSFFAVVEECEAECEIIRALHSTYEGARDSEYFGEFDRIIEFVI